MRRRDFFKVAGVSAAVAAVDAVGVDVAAADGVVEGKKEEPYVPVTDALVVRKLETWQDWKFGFMMHWGPYSQWGVVESWSICSEDWIKRPEGTGYVEYKERYQALPKTFNPIGFDPEVWAQVAKDAGTKYVVFTTKHHDGFSMFDTKETEYRITGPDCAFHGNARANIAKEVFSAFRKEGFGIGAYFSKPDWHCPDYWAKEWATPDRNVNYDTRKYTERWGKFVKFVHAQVGELTSEYGPVDILWLDGGWVNAEAHPQAVAWSGDVPWPQDIDMAGLASLARKNQPGLIVVDRAVGGAYENYRTPEQQVPDKPLSYPWETCMTLGNSWSYAPRDKYKPARKVVHLLVDVVAKGGNFLLNVGPDANGELPAAAVERLAEVGRWMRVNGEAIYGTRPQAPYREGKVCFTRAKDGAVYATYLMDEGERLPEVVEVKGVAPAAGARVRMVGLNVDLKWSREGGGVRIVLPEAAREVAGYAACLRIAKTA